MLTEFGKAFTFILFAIIFVAAGILTAKLIRPARPTKEKLSTYECGENPEGAPWVKFNIRFYVVALIFLIFDVEIVLIVPWAMVYQSYGIGGFFVGFIFIILLFLGMFYEWRKGDLDWVRPRIVPPRPMLKKAAPVQSDLPETNTLSLEQSNQG